MQRWLIEPVRTMIRLGIVGLIFGSFGSVVMTRLGNAQTQKQLGQAFHSMLFGRSKDQDSGQTLLRYDLIPLVSYCLLKGKSRTTGKPIPRYYPALEIGSAIVFVGTYRLVRMSGFLDPIVDASVFVWVRLTFINRLLLIILIRDITTLYLHIPIRATLLVVSLVPQLLSITGDYHIAFWGSLLWGALFYLIRYGGKRYALVRRGDKCEAFGEGDAMMAFVLGSLLSIVYNTQNRYFSGIGLAQVTTLFLLGSAIIAGIYTIGTLIKAKIHGESISGRSQVPFLPAMILMRWILLIMGEPIMKILYF